MKLVKFLTMIPTSPVHMTLVCATKVAHDRHSPYTGTLILFVNGSPYQTFIKNMQVGMATKPVMGSRGGATVMDAGSGEPNNFF